METIKIFFFAIASFFGIEEQLFFSEKTTVTVYPNEHKIEIIQKDIFALTQTENDKQLAKKEWEKLLNWESNKIEWSEDLKYFSNKKIEFLDIKNDKTVKITLVYDYPNDMTAMGIWYNEEKNQFSMNYIPEDMLKTKEGIKNGIFWNCDGGKTFSFTITPFTKIPQDKKFLVNLYSN